MGRYECVSEGRSLGEVIIPGLQKSGLIFLNQFSNGVKLRVAEPVVRRELNGNKPKLRFVSDGPHMDVWGFVRFVAVKEESIRTNTEDDGHRADKFEVKQHWLPGRHVYTRQPAAEVASTLGIGQRFAIIRLAHPFLNSLDEY